MIERFVKAWDQNKDKLKGHIATHPQEEYDSYESLVKLLFNIVINPAIAEEKGDWEGYQYDTNHICKIDDGQYQGTLIFVLHTGCYQPSTEDYIYTSVGYGSCSGCDTLQAIHLYEDGLPTDGQIEDYMTLCLHLLQNCREMGSEND